MIMKLTLFFILAICNILVTSAKSVNEKTNAVVTSEPNSVGGRRQKPPVYKNVKILSQGIKVHSINSPDFPLQDPPNYKNIRIVELETIPFFRQVDQIRKMEMNDLFMFILTSDKLYTYTMDGKFVAQIGRSGKREGEYTELSTFYVANNKKEITIIDHNQNQLIHYNFWGEYMYTDTVPKSSFQWMYQTLLTRDNKLLIYRGLSMDDAKAYSFFDLEKKEMVEPCLSYQPITVGNYLYPFSFHPMAQDGKDIDLLMPLCDTVYTYQSESSSFQPKYVIETFQKMASKDKIRKHTPSYSDDVIELGKQGFFTGFSGIYESENKVLLQYTFGGVALGYYLFDKSLKSGVYHLYSLGVKDKKFPFHAVVHAHGNEFIAFEKGRELLSIKKLKDKKIAKRIKSLKDDSPCLIFYEF